MIKEQQPLAFHKKKNDFGVKIHFITNCVVAIAKLRIVFLRRFDYTGKKYAVNACIEIVYENIGHQQKQCGSRKRMKYL